MKAVKKDKVSRLQVNIRRIVICALGSKEAILYILVQANILPIGTKKASD